MGKIEKTRKVVKDPLPKHLNRGEAEDLRAAKKAELVRLRKDNGMGKDSIREVVDGFAEHDYQCTVCGATNKGPRQPLFTIPLPCSSCGLKTHQERVRNES